MSIYVCYTIMHVYISVLKKLTLEKDNKTIIVLTDHIYDYDKIVSRIKQLEIFQLVLIIKDKELTSKFNSNKLNYLGFRKNIIDYFDKETCLADCLEKEF